MKNIYSGCEWILIEAMPLTRGGLLNTFGGVASNTPEPNVICVITYFSVAIDFVLF